MQAKIRKRILEITKADKIQREELIQPLWNEYGTLSRIFLRNAEYSSVIVKHIKVPKQKSHPRGFGGSISNKRKIRSYKVETHWYKNHNQKLADNAPTPLCLAAFSDGDELFLLLEDLATKGFTKVLYSVSWPEIKVVLKWLANFHASFLGDNAEGLWSSGTYWHLQTRPEELARIEGTRLYFFASLLDARLRCAEFSTLVHGDAKLANFLFKKGHYEVAAVDFQYVGRGAAVKDLAYFIGSCLDGDDCERNEDKILDLYFTELEKSLPDGADMIALQNEWRALYPIAWADFERFMSGWSPGHRKLTDYSNRITSRAIDSITKELMDLGREACLAAGKFIKENSGRNFELRSKGFESKSSDLVTEIDLRAQSIILEILRPSMKKYDLGLLAEEGSHDNSRLKKHAFWTIDPLDGTQYFVEGKPGYAVSIALVLRSGEPILGLVYDPVADKLYEAEKTKGLKLNGKDLQKKHLPESSKSHQIKWFADRSLRENPAFDKLKNAFDIRFEGGAVSNSLKLLTEARSIYIKAPKKALGGCAIWDLAAVSLMLKESSSTALTYDGASLNLNRSETIFFNDTGLAFISSDLDSKEVLAQIKALTE